MYKLKLYNIIYIGTKYSIAKPGSRGRYEGELLLREDQLLSGTVYETEVERANILWHLKGNKRRREYGIRREIREEESMSSEGN